MKDIAEKGRFRRCLSLPKDDMGELWQLRVEWDEHDLATTVELALERMTSSAQDSQVMRSKRNQSICWPRDDVPRLIRALQAAYEATQETP
jgi:hypothetical protein